VELNERFRDRGVSFVSIDRAPRSKAGGEFLATNKVVHTVLSDPTGATFDAYRVSAIPTTVIIDRQGRAVYRHVGYSPGGEETFAKEIEALLARAGGEA
jgi:peroxiredoxin